MQKWFRKRVHISWLIAFLSIGIISGVTFSLFVKPQYFTNFSWLIAATSLCFIAVLKRYIFLCAVVLLAGGLFGLWRGTTQQQALQSYNGYFGKQVIVMGTITDDPSFSAHGNQRFTLTSVVISGQRQPGKVWLSTSSKIGIKRGDTISVKGKLQKRFDNLPASMYFARIMRVQRPYPGDLARRLRDWFADAIRHTIPSPQSDLAVGYLVGQRSSLPASLDAQLKVVGLTHVVVASGYNLTILVRFARRLFARVSKYLALLTSMLLTLSFMCMTGFSPSMSRAGLVASLSLLAWYYGRRIHPFVLLPFAAAVTTIINPSYAWGDISWLLSFLSFAGVIIIAPLIHAYFWGKQPLGIVHQTFIDTMSAQLATLPLMVFVFGSYSPYALLANILVLPLVPLAMLLSFIAGIGGLLTPSFAHYIGLPATVVLRYTTVIVGKIAHLPNASMNVQLPVLALIGGYVFIACAVLALHHITKHDFHSDSVVE